MEPGVKDRDFMYKLIIGQLYHDGHNQLALDLSNSIGLNPYPPPSDKLFRLISDSRLVKDDADEEKKGTDMQMSLNPVVPSIDNLSIDEECGDYFPFLALPNELKVLVFSYLSIKDRMRARVTKNLVEVEAKSKYHVKELIIAEKCCIRGPTPPVIEQYEYGDTSSQSIVFIESKSYSSDCIRRIAHNASIGLLAIDLRGSSEFHREVYSLIKDIDIGELNLEFENEDLRKEIIVESFVLDLARSCKQMSIDIDSLTPENIHELYKIMLDGSTKLRRFFSFIDKEKCISFLQLIGITYRNDTFFSNGNIEVYKFGGNEEYARWHVFDGQLEMMFRANMFEGYDRNNYFHLTYHETSESLEKAKNRRRLQRVEIDLE